MITIIEGGKESGKTTVLEEMIRDEQGRGKTIIRGLDKQTIESILDRKYGKCLIVLDEQYNWFSSRRSMSNNNRLVAYVASMSDGLCADIVISVRDRRQVDRRVREKASLFLICLGKPNKDGVVLVVPEIIDRHRLGKERAKI